MAKIHFKQFLPALFEKIELGKPVHYKRFLLGLAESGFCPNQIEHIFNVVNIGKKRYRVTINQGSHLDYRELRELCIGDSKVISEKALAAARGKSHSKSASGVMVIIHTEDHPLSPFCAILEQGVPREMPQLKSKLILVENFELFLEYKSLLAYINKESSQKVSLDEFDVMYSQGSAILSKQYRSFLMGYSVILCMFDIDFGGLVIFNGLRKVNSGCIFVLPNNVDYLIEKYGFKINKEEEDRIKTLSAGCDIPKVVKKIARLILSKGLKIEQEVYLLELGSDHS